MIVAITGGTGFIGKKLVQRHLAQGDTVRILTRRNRSEISLCPHLKIYRADLTTNSNDLIPFVKGADLLYHCAAELRDTGRMYAVHVQGTSNLLKAAIGRIGRWVQLSSVGVYGPHIAGVVTEETPLNPTGIYEKTKAESDLIILRAAESEAIRFSILRPSIVFGEGMTNRSLFQLVSAIDKGVFFFIGKRGASANYIHVDNVVEGLIICGRLPQAEGRIYNLSDWRSMEEFITIIARQLGKSMPSFRIPEGVIRLIVTLLGVIPKFPLSKSRVEALTNRCSYTIARIKQELGYRHVVSIEEGLARLVTHWKSTQKGILT
ncbi:MAG: NAD(P)-dependent oxidoreductase [Thermodesulfobacteriota bacterium]